MTKAKNTVTISLRTARKVFHQLYNLQDLHENKYLEFQSSGDNKNAKSQLNRARQISKLKEKIRKELPQK